MHHSVYVCQCLAAMMSVIVNTFRSILSTKTNVVVKILIEHRILMLRAVKVYGMFNKNKELCYNSCNGMPISSKV